MEGPAVLVCESTLPYTQLSSLCRSFTFSPVPLCGFLSRLGYCPSLITVAAWSVRLFLQNLTEYSWIFLFVFGFIFCLMFFLLASVLPGLYLLKWESDLWTGGLDPASCWSGSVSWSSSALQGIHLQAQFKHFLFFLFFTDWPERLWIASFQASFLKLWWYCHFLITSFLKGNYLCCEL